MQIVRRFSSRLALAVAVGALFGEHAAVAGRTRFGWLYDSEVVPERGVELETWLLEEDGKGKADETGVWWGPVIGVSDRVELAVPLEMAFAREAGQPGVTNLERVGVEVRWRLTDPDPVEGGPLAPLLRLGVKRLIGARETMRLEGDAVLGLDVDRVHMLLDMGAVGEVGGGAGTLELRPSAGVSVRVTDELSLSAEIYSELTVVGAEAGTVNWVAAGPGLAWVHGRFWLSFSFDIGLIDISAAPRLNWAVAF